MKVQVLRQRLEALLGSVSEGHYNGLQVEGRPEVKLLVGGVSASEALIQAAIRVGADAIVVHHGLLWKQEPIVGMLKKRLQLLLRHDLSLFAYHLPLDLHLELGNNAQLAHLCGWQVERPLQTLYGPLVWTGRLASPLPPALFYEQLTHALDREPWYEGSSEAPALIERLAWCSGAGQRFVEQVAAEGITTYVTGEVSEQTVHAVKELGLHFYAAGHHATERGGVQALGAWVAEHTPVRFLFLDLPNPV